MRKEKNFQYYKNLLPKKLTVKIHKTQRGDFWAKIKELPHCYTQGKDFLDLIEMVNDAVFTYFEVPKKFREKLGYYVPERFLEELKRRKWERIFREIISKGRFKERVEVFKISRPA